MNVSLTPELERLVTEKVESGMYTSASEVIREALRLLKERDELRQTRLAELRREIQVGLDQLEQGQYSTYDEPSLKALVQEVRTEGREKRARKQNSAAA
jgi:antitoxin ParD1/3/4